MPIPIHDATTLRLQVETTPPLIRNVFPDPNGEQGMWAWFPAWLEIDPTQVFTSDGVSYTFGNGAASTYAPFVLGAMATKISGGEGIRFRYKVLSSTGSMVMGIYVTFFDANGAQLASPANLGNSYYTPTVDANGIASTPTFVAPSGTVSCQISMQSRSTTSAGATAAAGSQVRLSEFTAAVGTPAALDAAVPGPIDPVVWSSNLLGPTHSIEIEREELAVGLLNATLLDPTLDPATSSALAPGRLVRVQALIGSTWQTMFRGRLRAADVTYGRGRRGGTDIATRINIEAVDQLADLANVYQPTTAVRPKLDRIHLLTQQLLPYKINGSGNPPAGSAGPDVFRNPAMSSLDRIVLARDSERGFAWMSRDGRISVATQAGLSSGAAATIQAAFSDVRSAATVAEEYSDADIGFSTSDVRNHITIKWLRATSSAEVEEIQYGPYVDQASVARYGVQAAEYVLAGATGGNGLPESAANAAAYANAILAVHASPVRKARSLRMPVRDPRSLGHAAMLDLYDLVSVRRGSVLPATNYRITSIKHTITTDKWLVDYGFDATNALAAPGTQPQPRSSETTDGTWQPVTLQNSWTQLSGREVEYIRMGTTIMMRGVLTTASGAHASVAFTLPAGYRPTKVNTYLSGSSQNEPWGCVVNASGTVQIYKTGVTANYLNIAVVFSTV